MAPEIARGHSVGGRADVFSLGVLLFECFAGRRLYPEGEPLSLLLKLALENAPRLASVRPDLPEALDALVARFLARDPLERSTAADALAELEALGGEVGVTGLRRARALLR